MVPPPSPSICTLVTLVDLRARLTRHLSANHVEVPHVVARRCLMALSAVRGVRRRVAKLRDRPLRRRVALPAVLTEQLEVVAKELIVQSVPDLASRYVHICGPVPTEGGWLGS